MITLNGQQVPGHNITVRAGFKFDDKLLSGMSSSTAVSEGGIKPQTLSVTLQIKKINLQQLQTLIALARSTDEDGKRTVYTISNETAKAGNIREVRFSENFTYADGDRTRHWNVAFTLMEYLSVPEKTEQRQQTVAAKEQAADLATTTEPTTVNQPTYTSFEYILKAADDALAP